MEEKLGSKYTEGRAIPFAKSYEESGPGTPVFFILSPGVDPLKDVEALGKKLGFTEDNRNFNNISLGQGQEIVAEQAMELAAKEGHWVVLQVRGLFLLAGDGDGSCKIGAVDDGDGERQTDRQTDRQRQRDNDCISRASFHVKHAQLR